MVHFHSDLSTHALHAPAKGPHPPGSTPRTTVASTRAGLGRECARPRYGYGRRVLAWAALLGLSSSACAGSIERMTLTKVAPGVLQIDDIGVVCGLGETLTAMLTTVLKRQPDKAVMLSVISAALCNEERVWEAELERRRATYLSTRAQDAAVWAQFAADAALHEAREHGLAARRHAEVWRLMEKTYELPESDSSGECPKLREREQMVYLLGMTSGLLAVLHDGAASHSEGVSYAVARSVARGVRCLDDERYWGVPSALEAAVYNAIPGSAPEGVDPWQMLEAAAARGERSGVWLSRALHALSTAAAGQPVRPVIESHVAATRAQPDNSDVALLNEFAIRLIRHESDRLWIDQSGRRTPMAGLGQFPTPAAEAGPTQAEQESMDDLLDDALGGPEPSAGAEAAATKPPESAVGAETAPPPAASPTGVPATGPEQDGMRVQRADPPTPGSFAPVTAARTSSETRVGGN